MFQYLLFAGGHEGQGAPIEWSRFLGSFEEVDEAAEKVPVGYYYTILDGQTGGIAQRGHKNAQGELKPYLDAP